MKTKIKKTAKIGGIVLGGVIIASGIILGVSGWWPIARADGASITYNTFRDNFMLADHFYRSNLRLAGKDDRIVLARDAQRDLQRVTMQELIERILVDHELEKRYSASDLQQLIDNKMSAVDLGTADIAKATQLMYGLTPEQFKEFVLIPKAKREILDGNLMLQNSNLNDWLTTRKKEVGVSIFIPALYWNNDAVEVK